MKKRSFLKWLGVGGVATASVLAARSATAGNRYYSGPVTDHFDGTVFYNPGGIPPGSFTNLLKWQFGGGNVAWPESYPSPFADAVPDQAVDGADLRVTMVGHATLLIQTGGMNILTDPVWSDRASPFSFAGPKRVNPPGIAFADLPTIHAVLVSHNHYDHLDIATLKKLADIHDPVFLTPLGNDAIMDKAVAPEKLRTGDWGDIVELSPNMKIHFEPAHHWSARGAGDRRMALWAAFVIETPAGKIYHVGDTGFHDGINYRAAAEKHGDFRLAILPIGAYEPRWFMVGQHQNPDEAVRGHMLCGAAHTVGHHWGTFNLTNEGIEEPLDALASALEEHGVSKKHFRPLRPGESWDVPGAAV